MFSLTVAGTGNVREAMDHQTGHVLPVATLLIGKFFLQYSADRDHRGKRVTKNHELHEKIMVEITHNCRDNDRDHSIPLYNWRERFVDPKIRVGYKRASKIFWCQLLTLSAMFSAKYRLFAQSFQQRPWFHHFLNFAQKHPG
jgi:hypothetical protein